MAQANLSTEFNQKYRNCFLPAIINNNRCIVCVEQVETLPVQTDEFRVAVRDWKSGDSWNLNYKDYAFDFTWPELGFRNFPAGNTVFFGKKAEKQFSRGVCPGTVYRRSMEYNYVLESVGGEPKWQFKSLEWASLKFRYTALQFCSLFDPQFPLVREAIESLGPNRLFVGLSPRYGLALSNHKDYDFCIYRDLDMIGYASTDGKYLTSWVHPLLKQEWTDFLFRTRVPCGQIKDWLPDQ